MSKGAGHVPTASLDEAASRIIENDFQCPRRDLHTNHTCRSVTTHEETAASPGTRSMYGCAHPAAVSWTCGTTPPAKHHPGTPGSNLLVLCVLFSTRDRVPATQDDVGCRHFSIGLVLGDVR
jgi:hypothetical protein